ncbi:hypothetical protein ANO14919_130110 [Xylariales sp. No.14919]|nr:hypothetical protein ANO14919_130110 [Xylariales sp. No.14919]
MDKVFTMAKDTDNEFSLNGDALVSGVNDNSTPD